jgi:hypothetical protein
MPKPIRYTSQQRDFVRVNCTMARRDLTAAVNAEFGTSYKVDDIKSLCTRQGWLTGRTGCYQKGCIPANKGKKMDTGPNRTSFKKGDKPHNWKPVGAERISSDGYKQRKMTDTGYPPHDWVEVHRLLWIKQNGDIPKNHLVIFIDGDKTNISIENLTLLSRAEHVTINKNRLRNVPSEFKQAGITLGRLINKKAELNAN